MSISDDSCLNLRTVYLLMNSRRAWMYLSILLLLSSDFIVLS